MGEKEAELIRFSSAELRAILLLRRANLYLCITISIVAEQPEKAA